MGLLHYTMCFRGLATFTLNKINQHPLSILYLAFMQGLLGFLYEVLNCYLGKEFYRNEQNASRQLTYREAFLLSILEVSNSLALSFIYGLRIGYSFDFRIIEFTRHIRQRKE